MNYRYKLVVSRSLYEYHFVFKKVTDAAAFAEEFMRHQVPCEDDVKRDGEPIETTFTITFEKFELGEKEED